MSWTTHPLGRAVLTAATALLAFASNAQSDPEPTALLFGQVVGPEQKPVAGATVRVLRSRLETLPNRWDQNTWDHTYVCAEARTDDHGKFRVKVSADGIYGLTAQLGSELVTGLRNHVRPGESVLLELKKPRLVSGRVLDADGVPVPGAAVRVLTQPDYGEAFLASELLRPMVIVRAIDADGEGAFRVHVPPDCTLLGAVIHGQRVYTSIVDVDTVDIAPKPEPKLHGRVVDATSGTPVAGAKVFAAYSSSDLPAATTDADGRFALATSSGYVHVVPPDHSRTFVRVERPELPTPDAPFEIAVEQGLSVKARLLTADGRPLAGARYYVAGAVNAGTTIYGGIHWSDRTGPNGEVEIGCLQPDRGIVGVVDVEGTYVPFLQLVPDQDKDLGDLRLATDGRVQGQVLDADGAPMEGAVVLVLPEELVPGVGGDWMRRFAVTGPTGAFSIRGLKPGTYDVAAAANGFLADFASCDTAKAEPLTLRLSRGETMRGRVTDPAGKPVPGATVSLFERDGASEQRLHFGLATYRGTADQDGRFEVHGLPAEVVVDVQAFGEVDGKPTHARLGLVQVGAADLELMLGK